MRPSVFLVTVLVWLSAATTHSQTCQIQPDVILDRNTVEQTAKEQPDNAVAHANLARVYLQLRLYETSKVAIARAIDLDNTNADAYYIRASTYMRLGQLDEADRDLDLVIQYCPTEPNGYLLKSTILFERLTQEIRSGKAKLVQASLDPMVSVLRTGVERTKDHPAHAGIRSDLEGLTAFHDYFAAGGTASIGLEGSEPGVTALKYLSKPRPGYTDVARRANAQGTAKLMVLFGASGKVEGVIALNRLDQALEQQAMIAAGKITFEPMKRDGKPVSTVRMVEYTFSIY